jgi:hypothetical protein
MRIPFFLLGGAYALAFVLVPPATVRDHALYLISMGSNLMLFYMVYSFVKRLRSPADIFDTLLFQNLLVVAYCYVQLLVGFDRMSFFGIEEFSLHQNRLDQRLSGPFNAVGITAEYLVIQILIAGYVLLHEKSVRKRLFLFALIASNFAFLVATGNRGGFISLIFGGLLFLFHYRREIGLLRMTSTATAAVIIFFVMSLLIVTYTPFNRLYERLANTSIESGIPDTRRKLWPMAWQEIKERPIFGHGPRLSLLTAGARAAPGLRSIPHPHNLYLHILYTVGIVGLAAYLIFFGSIFWVLRKAASSPIRDPVLAGVPKLGMIILLVFLIDQVKVEFLRYYLDDYQHYVFMLFGLFLAFSDRIVEKKPLEAPRGQV